jgi:hypothetical protein
MTLGLNLSFTICNVVRGRSIEDPYSLYNRVHMDAHQAKSPMAKGAETTCISSSGARRPIL